MSIIETLGTYEIFPLPETLIATPIEHHKWLILDTTDNTYWFDFTDEASLFSGTKYKNLESVRTAFSSYLKSLEKQSD